MRQRLVTALYSVALISALGLLEPATASETTVLFEQAKAALTANNDTEARRLLGESCEMDELISCTLLGKLLITGNAGLLDPKTGRDLLLKTCFRGDSIACQFFAVAAGEGQGGPKDLYAARHIFAYSCDMGDGRSCFYSAMDFNGATGLPTYPEAIQAALTKGCDLGNNDACKALNGE